jgi:ribosomal protein L40E
MPNVLPIVFIVLASLALVLTLLWLWQSLRHAFVHTLAAPQASDVVSPERAALLQEKQTLLLALKDLESERDSGKLSVEDFRELNDQYRKRAREVLRELDAMLAPHRDRARSLLSGAAAVSSSHSAPQPAAAQSAAESCKSCGAGNDGDAVFCKKCGTRLRSEAMV